MKNIIEFLLIIGIIISFIQLAEAVPTENEYGSVKAWFNDQEATVENVRLKVGEPAEIKVTVTSNISGHVTLGLLNPLVTQPYQVIEDTEFEERINNYNVPAGWSKTFTWKVKPNGAWTNGNAPINILVTFYNTQDRDQKKIEFTIADPIIVDEQYAGAISTPKPTSQTTEPASGAVSPSKSIPFVPAILVIAILLIAVWLWRRKHK